MYQSAARRTLSCRRRQGRREGVDRSTLAAVRSWTARLPSATAAAAEGCVAQPQATGSKVRGWADGKLSRVLRSE